MMNTFAQVEAYLAKIPMFSNSGKMAMKAYSLESIRSFLSAIGNPQDQFFSVHIAGTNGKGSTVKILEQVYTDAGFKTAAYISPHLISYTERFQINGKPISEEALVLFFNRHSKLIEQFQLSYFEIATACAFWWFAEQKVDLAIVECGLGGRLDATNVLEHKLAVITSIGLDHTEILGDTLAKIALEKAGICRPDIHLICGDLVEEARNLIQEHAQKMGCTFLEAANYHFVIANHEEMGSFHIQPKGGQAFSLKTRLINPIQSKNIEIALCVVENLQDQYAVNKNVVSEALQKLILPARFEPIFPNKKWLFDGFHNEESLDSALKAISNQSEEPLFILVFMRDKWTKTLSAKVKNLNARFIQLENERALSPKDAPELNWVTFSDLDKIFNKFSESLVIVGGSFYFYKSIKEWSSLILTNYDI